MQPDPAQSMQALVERARAALAGRVEAEQSGPAVGEAADGLVHAEFEADRLTVLRLDPKLLRQPIEDTATQILQAVNMALDARPGRLDTGPVLEELRAVQEQSVTEMAKLTRAFSDALNRANPG